SSDWLADRDRPWRIAHPRRLPERPQIATASFAMGIGRRYARGPGAPLTAICRCKSHSYTNILISERACPFERRKKLRPRHAFAAAAARARRPLRQGFIRIS